MGFVGVRNLTILLALTCIVCTAAVCTAIAVYSGDSAIDKTRDSSAQQLQSTRSSGATALEDTRTAFGNGLATCFSAATDAITQRTEEILSATARAVRSRLTLTFQTYQMHADKWAMFLRNVKPVSKIADPDWMLGMDSLLWADTLAFFDTGVRGLGIYSYSDTAIQYYESPETYPFPPAPEGFHHVVRLWCTGPRGNCTLGTAVQGGKVNDAVRPALDRRLPDGRFESRSCMPFQTSPLTGQECDMRAIGGCRNENFVATQGKEDGGVCYLSGFVPKELSLSGLVGLPFWPANETKWTHIVPLSIFMGILAIGKIADERGNQIGYFHVGIELRGLKAFLQTIVVGGEGAQSRIFVTAADNWIYNKLPISTFDQNGVLVAVSHGNATYQNYGYLDLRQVDTYTQSQRRATDATDPLIRGCARHIEQFSGAFEAFVDKVAPFDINATLVDGGFSELVAGDITGTEAVFGPPINITHPYLNGYYTAAELSKPPLPGFIADGTSFFFSVSEMTIGSTGTDARWHVVIVIDREYVLGETERKQANTSAHVQASVAEVAKTVAEREAQVAEEVVKSEEKVQDDLDQDRMILYIVVIAVAILLMVVSVIFVGVIVAPLLQLQVDMAEVAVMKLENVDEERPPSALAEVKEMQLSFKQMIANLREFRSYMPASVLVDSDDDTDADSDEPDRQELPTPNPQYPAMANPPSGELTLTKSNSHLSRHSHDRGLDLRRGVSSSLALGVTRRLVGIAVCNVRDYSGMVERGSIGVLETNAAYLTGLVEVVRCRRGLVDGFHADRFYASWNGAKSASGPRNGAGRCALGFTMF
eukprot:Hpha_TRINITY_DN14570_c0_g1::TRINITY_DN14570_c0_g1_i1::g.47292::m.47292